MKHILYSLYVSKNAEAKDKSKLNHDIFIVDSIFPSSDRVRSIFVLHIPFEHEQRAAIFGFGKTKSRRYYLII